MEEVDKEKEVLAVKEEEVIVAVVRLWVGKVERF